DDARSVTLPVVGFGSSGQVRRIPAVRVQTQLAIGRLFRVRRRPRALGSQPPRTAGPPVLREVLVRLSAIGNRARRSIDTHLHIVYKYAATPRKCAAVVW